MANPKVLTETSISAATKSWRRLEAARHGEKDSTSKKPVLF